MAILRLAGAGLKGLMGLGAKSGGAGLKIGGRTLGSLAREGLTDAAIVGGVTALPGAVSTGYGLATGDAVDDRLTKLAGQDPLDDKYKIGLGDRALSTLSGLMGGETIDQDTITKRKDDINLKDIKKDAVLTAALGKLGVDVDSLRGKSKSQVAAQYGPEIQEAELRRKSGIERDLRTSDPDYLSPVEQQNYNRTIAEIAREDRLAAQSLARQDNLQSRRDNLDLQMANLAFKEAESKRQFDYQVSKDKKDRLQALIAGLGSLGGAFAI